MEEQFKKALKNLRLLSRSDGGQSFKGQIFSPPWFEETSQLTPPEESLSEPENNLSERVRTLDALTDFASGELSKKPHNSSLILPGGGEIKKKESVINQEDIEVKSLNALKVANQSEGAQSLNLKYKELEDGSLLDGIFISEKAIDISSEKSDILEYY
jgi:hypothetical protein